MKNLIYLTLAIIISHFINFKAFSTTVLLDTSFAQDGSFEFNNQTVGIDFVNSIHVFQNNKILAGGGTSYYVNWQGDVNNLLLMQVSAQGELDSTFNTDGYNLMDYKTNSGNEYILNLFVTKNHIIAAVKIDEAFNLVYYHLDGTIDTSKGNNGIVNIAITSNFADFVTAKMDRKGRIVLAGYYLPNVFLSPCFARVHQDGTLDTSFANGGIYLHNSKYDEIVTDIAIVSNNDIYFSTNIVRYNLKTSQSIQKVAVNKLLANGAPDYSFGNGFGKALISISNNNMESTSLRMDYLGNIYVSGRYLKVEQPTNWDIFISKLKPNGKMDTSFGNLGVLEMDFGYMVEYATSILIDSNKQLLVGGYLHHINPYIDNGMPKKFITRLHTDGQLDTTFNDNGYFFIDEPGKLTSMRFDYNKNLILGGTLDIIYDYYIETKAQVSKVLINTPADTFVSPSAP